MHLTEKVNIKFYRCFQVHCYFWYLEQSITKKKKFIVSFQWKSLERRRESQIEFMQPCAEEESRQVDCLDFKEKQQNLFDCSRCARITACLKTL